ncbi:ParB N-terminal domain-containing protein [Tateyamaria sp. Alg231-49]|uniref:ParB/RepB/Spo0J family partition protein n=1 Tax=Tateyamaria sp. Alg231-49 TaxID=1922219 RepID=UPI000D558830|nr:ParB N-terminal domain-containing protein [Tateyamaria sp. Alg231-49]
MPDPLQTLPITAIDADALPRDRDIHDDEAQKELEHSIFTTQLRQPIEVWKFSEPHDGFHYGLISGFRRLAACRALKHDTIPAFIRAPRDIPDAIAAMVSENEIRSQISPWEKGRLILNCLQEELFNNEDHAIDSLFPATSTRQKKARLRSYTLVVQVFDGAIATPEHLSVARIERLAAAVRARWEVLLTDALHRSRSDTLAGQWSALEPVIYEALNPQYDESGPDKPGAPRRSIKFNNRLHIRRELTKSGWILRFSGSEAKIPGLMDDVMHEIERIFGPEP